MRKIYKPRKPRKSLTAMEMQEIIQDGIRDILSDYEYDIDEYRGDKGIYGTDEWGTQLRVLCSVKLQGEMCPIDSY